MTQDELDSIRRLTAVVNEHFSTELRINKQSLKSLLATLADLIQAAADAKPQIPGWQHHIGTFAHKIVFTAHSIVALGDGYEMQSIKNPDIKVEVIDYASVYVLTRSIIECYATLCYIYNNSLSETEKIFRYKLWEHSGLKSRLTTWNSKDSIKFALDPDEQRDLDARSKAEQVLMDKILAEIEQMPEYSKLEKKHLNKLSTHGLARIDSWRELIQSSNLPNPMFKDSYSLFSNFAHSEYWSMLQISQSSMNSQNQETLAGVTLCFSLVRIVVALTVDFLTKSFEGANIAYKELPIETKDAIEFLRKMG